MAATGIPKTIHQIWIGGQPMPESYTKNMKRLIEHNPQWQHVLWDDDAVRAACAEAGVSDAFERSPSLHNKIDIGRYAVLYLHGGVSVDLDVVSLQPLDALDEFERCLSGSSLVISECSFNEEMLSWENRMFGFSTLLNNAFFASPRASPIMGRLCHHCSDLVLKGTKSGVQWIDIMFTTGPLAVSRFFNSQPKHEYVVLPCRYVEPLMNFCPTTSLSFDTVLWHLGSMSWIPTSHKKVVFFAFVHRYTITTLVILIIATYALTRRRRRGVPSSLDKDTIKIPFVTQPNHETFQRTTDGVVRRRRHQRGEGRDGRRAQTTAW